MRATPAIVASRTTASILSPLSTACTSTVGTAGSGAEKIGVADRDRRSVPIGPHHARLELVTLAVEDGDLVTNSQPHHAHEVVRLVRWKDRLGPGRVETGHIEARTRHKVDSMGSHSGYTPFVLCSWFVVRRSAVLGSAFVGFCSQFPIHAFAIQSAFSTQHSTLLFRGQTLGKYKIAAALGSGGFGTVYLAHDTWIDKKVAIKVPHRQGLDFGELLREPRLLASVSHPNIVAIITAEKQDNVFFIVMEYVQGETLENIIALKGALELNRALDFTCQICNAVDHAHRQGVIHRDLRPANVLVTENDMLKVADFGTSRFLEIAAHGTTVIGSPPYMAPEQFQGKAVFASDIYSLGVTMYQMLTGMLPYDTPAPAISTS